jgi:hypothetical protein
VIRPISDQHWRDAFLRPDGRYDGELFEQLALRLLERLHGVGWRATAHSHDGSRDYEKRDRDGWIWAECKAYSERLSIYVLSSTLIMALLDEPHTVIVISRSALNANAIRRLAEFQVRAGKTISVLDGATLDDAIVATDLHRVYFPGLVAPLPLTPRLGLRCAVSCDVLIPPSELDIIETSNLKRRPGRIDTVRLAPIRLDILIRNLSSLTATTIRLEIEEGSLDGGLRVLAFGNRKGARKVSATVPPSGFLKVDLFLQAVEAGEFDLPNIRLHGEGAPNDPLSFGRLRVANAYDMALVGEAHRRVLADVERFLRHRRRPLLIGIEGASGTGKSRLLREIALVGLQEGFRCHIYNPELEDPKAAERTIRSLIADIYELPLVAAPEPEEPPRYGGALSPGTTLITRALYDESLPLSDHLVDLADAVIRRLNQRRTLIILDNAQSAPELLGTFLDLLTSGLRSLSNARTSIVVCFNTDLDQPESRAGALLRKLRGWAADARENGNTAIHRILRDFTDADVAEFLAQALSGDRHLAPSIAAFESTLHLLLQNVQPRPLNLWQSILYLADEGALVIEDGCLRVCGEATLLHQLQALPPDLQDLLQLRWRRISVRALEKGITEAELDWALRIAYVLGSEARSHLLSLGAHGPAVEHLVRAGVLAMDPADRVRFFHYQLFVFARTLYSTWDSALASQVKRRMQAAKLTGTKFQPYFIISHFAGSVTPQLVRVSVRYMAAQGLSTEYWRQYASLMLGHLLSPGRRASGVSLTAVALIGQWEQRLQSLLRGAETFREFLATKLIRGARNHLPSEQLVNFYYEAANAFLAIYSDAEALEVLNLALLDLQRARFPSEGAKNIAQARILNRQLATLKNFGRIDEALAAGRQALGSLAHTHDRSLAVETLFDMGGVLVRVPERRPEALELFEEGCSTFEMHRSEMREPAPCRYFYVRGQQTLHKGELRTVFRLCAEGTLHCKRVVNHFWGIRVLSLELVARLLQGINSDDDLRRIERLLTQSRDWMNVSHAERSRWGVQYLEGKYRLLTGERERAAQAFSSALRDLATRLPLAEQLAWRASVIQDIAASCRLHGIEPTDEAIGELCSESLQAEVRTILAMSDVVFNLFEKGRLKDALFSYNGAIVELP